MQFQLHRACGAVLSALLLVSTCGAEETLPRTAEHRFFNGHLVFSTRFFNMLFERVVDDQRLIEENMAGSWLTGLAHTQGRVTAVLVPHETQAVLDVQLLANASLEDGAAKRRLVTVYSSTSTAINARKRIHLDNEGVNLHDAQAWCSSAVQINDVEGPGPFVKSLVMRMSAQKIPELEQEASRRTESRAAQQLDDECNQLLGDASRAFRDKIRTPLEREGVWPSKIHFQSTANHMQLSLLGAKDHQPAAQNQPRKMRFERDIGVCMHETLVRNFCETLLAKRTVTDKEWLAWMKLLTGQSPRALWVHDRNERWQVTMAESQPVTATFTDDSMAITLRLSEVVRGERSLQRPITVFVKYRLLTTADGPALSRTENLVVRYSDEGPAKDEQIEWQSFVDSKFQGIFPPELYFDGLAAPSGGSWEKLRQFHIQEFSAEHGWLIIAYQIDRERQAVHEKQASGASDGGGEGDRAGVGDRISRERVPSSADGTNRK